MNICTNRINCLKLFPPCLLSKPHTSHGIAEEQGKLGKDPSGCLSCKTGLYWTCPVKNLKVRCIELIPKK